MKDYIRHQRGRMFDSDFLEFFSKVHPAAPFVLWIPIVVGTMLYAFAYAVTSWHLVLVCFPFGLLSWQVMEYFIHKKAFHWVGIGPITRRFHDISHGFHHKYPDDADRLVMPLAVSISLGTIIGVGVSFFHRPDLTVPWWCGLVSGYLFYDFTHWSTHFRKPLTNWGKKMRAHHMAHHFADPEMNFGISHRWIDALLGTRQKRNAEEQRHDDDGSFTPAPKQR
jgi:dihydroceramide fatty acyl 2-hydroxylase